MPIKIKKKLIYTGNLLVSYRVALQVKSSHNKLEGILLIVGYTGRLRPKGAPFQARSIIKGTEISILIYERVTKSAAKWTELQLKQSISKGATFWQKFCSSESERLKTQEKHGD